MGRISPCLKPQECAIPLFLSDKVYADFTRSYEDGLASLLPRFENALVPQIVEGLMSGDEDRIQRAATRVAGPARQAYVNAIRRGLTSSSSGERNASLTALFVLRDATVGGEILRAASDQSPSVRRHALFLAGRLRLREALAVVAVRLEDPSPDVRATAREVYDKLTRGRR